MTKNSTPKTESFKAWLEKKPFWEKYLWHLHLEKDVVSDADIKKCYRYLLEDYGVVRSSPHRPRIVFPVLDLGSVETKKVKGTLDRIENLKGVNAIDDKSVIEFGKNLTIIYGDNGSGKSGIGRLLSNACLSRKPRQLLPNAKVSTSSFLDITADFHITGSDVIKYTLGEVHKALKSFSVFDQECALIHLNEENVIEFAPSKIKVFDEVFSSIILIEELLQQEINARQMSNPADGLFMGETPVASFLNSLSCKTTDREIDDTLKFTAADKLLLNRKKNELTEKLRQDISKQKKDLQDECADLTTFKNTLDTLSSILSKAKAIEINVLMKEIKIKKDIADKLSVKSFDFAAFKAVGSIEWKSLITTAQKLYEKEKILNNGVEPDFCLLCRQKLNNNERTLFGEYWKFLKGTAEAELAAAQRSLVISLSNITNIGSTWPKFSETEVAVKILKKETPEGLKNIEDSFRELRKKITEWIENVKNEREVVYLDLKIDLTPISLLISTKKKKEEKLLDPTSAIRTLNIQIGHLEQKQQASRVVAKVKKYVMWLYWEEAIGVINLSATRSNTTRKKTEIMEELVVSRYVELFNDEVEVLDCNFGLQVGYHGRDVTTVKELRLEFAPGYNPSDILSEGEQTVSALADFLTEAKLDRNNLGIIFDDPVNSLDHMRKPIIAKRLVEEAKERQVIIFTHDIVFLLDLQSYAKSESVDCVLKSIRKNGDKVGVIKEELPWFALNVKSMVGYLRNDLVRIKKKEDGDQDEYRKEVKGWYEFLREAWERAVEERLFKGVVQRFNKSIQTKRLSEVDINQELIKEIIDGMTLSSNWLHNLGAGANPSIPKNNRLEKELNALADFVNKCK